MLSFLIALGFAVGLLIMFTVAMMARDLRMIRIHLVERVRGIEGTQQDHAAQLAALQHSRHHQQATLREHEELLKPRR